VPDARGFVWDARIRLAPLVQAAVRDACVDGTGRRYAGTGVAHRWRRDRDHRVPLQRRRRSRFHLRYERPRRYGTTFVATPWEGRFDHYVTVNGIRVPKNGEVGWWIENRWIRVWQGTVEEFAFDVAGR
jgi:hypothetical protein